MRCHAKYGPFRCDLEMSEHLPDRHVFTVEWDEDGGPLGRTADEVDLIAFADNVPPLRTMFLTPNIESVGVSGDGLPETVELEEAEPGETGTVAGVSADGRKWWLNPQTGGIVWEQTKTTQCAICAHPWHEEPCTVPFQPGDYATACGCMTAA